ncbi:MAG: Hsp70 family protein [Betaproteobacteria bacterium]|nr:Hsp70 family protein [Betaproteobacteria bacterium]
MTDYCAIDFGTSNSAVALPDGEAIRLVELEAGFTSIPTAVFFSAEDGSRAFGRTAVQAYVDGFDGRLMRSIKSILGSDLMDRATEVGLGLTIKYLDVVIAYLRELKRIAEIANGKPLKRVVLGRPVFFVDGDPVRDRQAERTLSEAARAAGFEEIAFQFEPIAAALDFERTCTAETLVMVADIGGGTSDFSLVRVGPSRHAALDRSSDILANHGVHVAGTDFDREVNLAAIMPALGLGSPGRQQSRVPGAIYFDLATWHLINTLYAANRVIECRMMRPLYAHEYLHQRLMAVLENHLGHALAASAEAAKIEVSLHGETTIDLGYVEPQLAVDFDAARQKQALTTCIDSITQAAHETLRQAGIQPDQVGALYFTGGSTGLSALTTAIARVAPSARTVVGDRFASVVSGLGVYAARRFARAAQG